MSEVDFGAIGAQVQAHLDSGGDGTTADASATQNAPVANATSPAAAAAPASGTPQAAAPNPADEVIEVTFSDGRVEQIARKDLPNAILMQRDYTQKTQKLAEMQRQMQPIAQAATQLAQEREQIAALFQNPQLLAKFAQETYGAEFAKLFTPQQQAAMQQQGLSPDDIITAQQASDIAEQRTQAYMQQMQARLHELESRFEQKTQRVVQQGIQELQDSQEIAAHQKVLDKHVDSLLDANPLLKAIPEMGDALRFRVFTRNPQTQEEAMRLLSEEADRQGKALEKQFEERQKQALAGKAKLTTHGTEPPGGVGVQPTPVEFKKKDGSIDWKALSGAAEAFVSNSRRK